MPKNAYLCAAAVVVCVVVAGAGCAPDAPSDAPGPSVIPPAPPPIAAPRPVVTGVSPSKGSTGGGTPMTITGSGFQLGATVTLGGVPQAVSVQSHTITFVTTAQPEGPVELVVTNPDGQLERLDQGFTFASPQSFDFNGTWEGLALAHPDAPLTSIPRHSDMGIQVSVKNNVVTGVTCGDAVLVLPTPPVVNQGAFTFAAADGVVAISGRIVSDGHAIGTVDTLACPGTRWGAVKK